MRDLFRAFFFKLTKDLTFRITLIIGAGLSVLMILLYVLLDRLAGYAGHVYCTGNNLFVTSFNPAQNFGIAIPVNLITFTVLEFSHGIIRNKIVAGNSKVKIYLSLFLTGLVFTLSLLFTYVGFCTLLGTIIGGFDPNGFGALGIIAATGYGALTPDFIWRYFVCCVLAYITITAFNIFIASTFRNIGPSIPVSIIMSIVLVSVLPLIVTMPYLQEKLGDLPLFLNPMHNLGAQEMYHDASGYHLLLSDKAMIGAAVSNVMWSAIFVLVGTFQFVKRDVK